MCTPAGVETLDRDRFRAKSEHLKSFKGLSPESQGQNLASTVLYVPHSRDSGLTRTSHLIGKEFHFKKLYRNEVYYTARSLSEIVKHSCSKLHCQKVLNRNCLPIKSGSKRWSHRRTNTTRPRRTPLHSTQVPPRFYRVTSLMRKRLPLEPYSSPMPRGLGWSERGGASLYERGIPVGLRVLKFICVG